MAVCHCWQRAGSNGGGLQVIAVSVTLLERRPPLEDDERSHEVKHHADSDDLRGRRMRKTSGMIRMVGRLNSLTAVNGEDPVQNDRQQGADCGKDGPASAFAQLVAH